MALEGRPRRVAYRCLRPKPVWRVLRVKRVLFYPEARRKQKREETRFPGVRGLTNTRRTRNTRQGALVPLPMRRGAIQRSLSRLARQHIDEGLLPMPMPPKGGVPHPACQTGAHDGRRGLGWHQPRGRRSPALNGHGQRADHPRPSVQRRAPRGSPARIPGQRRTTVGSSPLPAPWPGAAPPPPGVQRTGPSSTPGSGGHSPSLQISSASPKKLPAFT